MCSYMQIFKRKKKGTLEEIDLKELRTEEITLKQKRKRLTQEIEMLEKQKTSILNQFKKGLSTIQKKTYKTEYKQKDMDVKLKYRHFEKLNKNFTFISNLIAIKSMENDLKESFIWEKIKNIPQEELEKYLAVTTINLETRETAINDLNSIFENTLLAGSDEIEMKDDFDEFTELIETGEMTPEEVEERLSQKKKKKNKEDGDSDEEYEV